jgi:hypothetical protein
VALSPREPGALFRHTFALESPAPGGAARGGGLFAPVRFALVMLVVVLAVDYGAGVAARSAISSWRPVEEEVGYMGLSLYRGTDWGRRYWDEFKASKQTRYVPYVGWTRRPFAGAHVNIDERGVRRTHEPAGAGPATPAVFVFGGSTVWGTGARDGHTIPSELARAAERHGVALRVTNFGESGYVSWQGVLALTRRLAAGDRPAFVIFYDGINDVFAALQSPHEERPPQNLGEWQAWMDERMAEKKEGFGDVALRALRLYREQSLLGGVVRRLGLASARAGGGPPRFAQAEAVPVPRLADKVVRQYLQGTDVVAALGRQYGFRALFTWQPSLFTKKRLSPEEERHKIVDHFDAALFAAVHREATRQVAGHAHVHDLSGVFDGEPGTVFIDFAHVGEEGNRIVAERLFELWRAQAAPAPAPAPAPGGASP